MQAFRSNAGLASHSRHRHPTACVTSAPMLVSPHTVVTDTQQHACLPLQCWSRLTQSSQTPHSMRAFRSNAGLASHTRHRHPTACVPSAPMLVSPHTLVTDTPQHACLPLQCWSRFTHSSQTTHLSSSSAMMMMNLRCPSNHVK